jgi:hypothetical protein
VWGFARLAGLSIPSGLGEPEKISGFSILVCRNLNEAEAAHVSLAAENQKKMAQGVYGLVRRCPQAERCAVERDLRMVVLAAAD